MSHASSGAQPAAVPSILQNLNAEQLAAVTLAPQPQNHALILAGAGSGKTRVLTTRIAWLVHNGFASPGNILAVTFTNKAAREMLTRLGAMLPLNVRGMWIGTFHGLCNRMLRAHHKSAGLPASFQILDMQDQLSAIKRLLKQYDVDEEHFPPKQVQWFINAAKEDGQRPGDMQAHSADEHRKIELYQLYEQQCQREGVADFGELMLRSCELLRDNPAVREHYQHRFRHILVDEFQDTNRLQYSWLKQLAGPQSSVLAVGDDDQSIYAFRGACVGNMADFLHEFHVQHQIKLEQNYRSYANILQAANELIAHNHNRLGKNLRTEQGAGEPIRVFEAPSDFAEAQWLVDEVRQLAREGTARNAMAALYRSNAQSRVLETALFNAGVPYRVYGGLRFFERAEIKHALAYLRLLENPHDDTSFVRVVNFPARGIGARSVEQLQDAARSAGTSLHGAVSLLPPKTRSKLDGFIATLEVMREQTQGRPLREIVAVMLEASGLLEHYKAERDGADRVENLEELLNAAESFVIQEGFGRDAVALPLDEQGEPLTQSPVSQGLDAPLAPDAETGETLSPLAAFLANAALEAGDHQAQAGQDAVQLMTVHAAKGLEFDVVFITGLEESIFPHDNALSDTQGLEEERRLMYVAITRARQRLYLSMAQTRMLHGQTRYHVRSRFLDELPAHTLKWLTPEKGGFGSYAPQDFGGGFGSRQNRSAGGFDIGSYAAPAPVQKNADVPHGLRAGMQVFHNKFGEGAVLAVEGAGDDARAQIRFPRHGTKWLALGVAKLTVVDTK